MPTNIQINKSSSGDTTLIAAPGAGRFIRVYRVKVMSNGDTNVSLKSGSTVLDGPCPLTDGNGYAEQDDRGAFNCGINEAFIINQTGTAQLGGSCSYAVKGV